jgi:hypothetical protein
VATTLAFNVTRNQTLAKFTTTR